MVVAPRIHKIYYDEDIYLNVGQNIAHLKKVGMCNGGHNLYGEYNCNRLEYNKEPNAWPYLVSIVFRLFDVSHTWGFILNNIAWALSIFIVFMIGYLLFNSRKTGLFSAMIFAFIPEGIIWSNTTSAETSAAFFAGFSILSITLYVKEPELKRLFLASVVLPFSFQFRPESLLIVLPAATAVVLMCPGEFKKERTYFFLLFVLFLSMAHCIHLFAVKNEGWGTSDSKFALKYFYDNFCVNFLFYIKNKRFPVLFSIFFLSGICFAMPKRKQSNPGKKGQIINFFVKEKMIILLWFSCFWGIFLFFYAGSYNYGADVRFSLVSYMPFAIMSGYGASCLSEWILKRYDFKSVDLCLCLLICFCFVSFLPYIRAEKQEAWGARADHKYAEVMAANIPSHSIILTHNPTMFLLFKKNAVQGSIALHEKEYLKELARQYIGGVYFHFNFWCNVDDPSQQSFCKTILSTYKNTQLMTFREQNYKYALYKLEINQE
jgi:4-amino-4-deoxy-L-arabinose transferase-like glycosyltransferase